VISPPCDSVDSPGIGHKPAPAMDQGPISRVAPAAIIRPGVSMDNYLVGPAEIFTLFFVTLGPLKMLGSFRQRTGETSAPTMRRIALWAFAIATVAVIAGAFLGAALAASWHVSLPALTLTAGIIFFLVALNQLMAQYQPDHAAVPDPLPPSPLVAASRLVFPIVLTPYGLAAGIVLIARSAGTDRTAVIIAILLGVMVLDLLAMWFVRRVLIGIVPLVLQVVGAVLAVMQVALSIQFIILGLRLLDVLSTPA